MHAVVYFIYKDDAVFASVKGSDDSQQFSYPVTQHIDRDKSVEPDVYVDSRLQYGDGLYFGFYVPENFDNDVFLFFFYYTGKIFGGDIESKLRIDVYTRQGFLVVFG